VRQTIRFIAAAALALAFVAPVPAQQKPDLGKIAGAWALEVNAGGEFYYLTLDLKAKDGKLEGGLSEQNGMFKDVPLANVEYDGTTLKFDVKIPTPPDGQERLVKTELKLVADKLEGLLTLPDMGMSVGVAGTKK
jgi:hypothetical protein